MSDIEDLFLSEKPIQQQAQALVDSIREYSLSQAGFWRCVPYLALQADGRTGYCGALSSAYRRGFWPLGWEKGKPGYEVAVDLATGALADAYAASSSIPYLDYDIAKESVIKPAKDDEVARLAFCMAKLDARVLVSYLLQEQNTPYCDCYDPVEQEVWRTELLETLGLTEMYER